MNQQIVISDTSPIRALNHLQRLDLLSKLFSPIFVPPAVRNELARPRGRFPAIDITKITGAIERAPSHDREVLALKTQLDAGEAEAVALAQEIHAELLIDERAGRSIARQRGIKVTGVIGVLVEARRRNLIPNVVPLLLKLRLELNFFLADALIEQIRTECGE